MIALPTLGLSRRPITMPRLSAPQMPPAEAWRVRQIRTALAAVDIPSRPGLHVRGPRVTVYRFQVPAAKMERAVRRSSALEVALDCEGIALRQQGRWLVVEVPRHDARPILLEAAGPILGVSNTGDPIVAGLTGSTPHAVVGAQTGGGKTELLRSWALLESRRPQTRLVLLDMEGSSWAPFQGSGHVIAADPREVDAALSWAVDRLGAAPDGWRVVVMVDEAQMLSPFAQGLLRDIAERGRKHAVHLVVATQYIRQDVLDRRLTSNAPIRIAGRVHDATASKQVLGIAGAERLLGRGDMLMVVGGSPPVRFQACLPEGDVWRHIGQVPPLELEETPAAPAAAVHPGHVREDDAEAIAWALENGEGGGPASATAIQRFWRVGTDRARRIRDAAAALPRHPPTGPAPVPPGRLIPFPAGRAVGQ